MARSFVLGSVVLTVLSLSISPVRADQASQPSSVGQAASSDKTPYSRLTPDQRDIIDRGEVSDGAYVAGGIVGSFVGLGIGQAIEGRYMPTGFIITIGEVTSTVLLADALLNCTATVVGDALTAQNTSCSLGTAGTIGLVGIIGFRVWEIVDVWATPPSINARYRRLKRHVEDAPETTGTFGIIPALASSGPAGSPASLDGAALAYQIRF